MRLQCKEVRRHGGEESKGQGAEKENTLRRRAERSKETREARSKENPANKQSEKAQEGK
jgi:hypothetical protein